MQSGYDASSLSNTLAAVYATQKDAREAIKELHKAGFKQTWLGMTKPADSATGEPMVEDPGSLSRFISAGGDRMPLHRALLQHGISETQAEQIESEIAPGCAIVTAYGEDNPAKAHELLTLHKGQVVGGALDMPEAVRIASAQPRTGVDKEERKEAEHARDAKRTEHHEHGRDDERDVVVHAYRDDYTDYPSETFVERGGSGLGRRP
ncbi:MAG: hypothetical protein PVSMB8_13110 [Vulcanimicrobiaceae bacterium]